MAHFVLTRRSPLPPDACWGRVTAWRAHGDRVPFTRVTVVRGTGRRPGDVIQARTRIAGFLVDDPMEIAAFTAPAPGRNGLCRLEKLGRPVRGWAELRVRALDGPGGGSEVVWEEEIEVTILPRFLDPLVALGGRLVFGRVLGMLLGPTSRRV
ncbi:SRPBCC family protein [Kitasatospora sp. NPDC048538]|uniref:SRPBCC family protein n=1 Tax=unclassified Kitasatospora TaxID=2633591 RepID=UPI0033F30326